MVGITPRRSTPVSGSFSASTASSSASASLSSRRARSTVPTPSGVSPAPPARKYSMAKASTARPATKHAPTERPTSESPATERHESGLSFLFDLDGTLVDSVYQHVLSWHEALQGAGIPLSIWRIHRRI